MTIATTKGKEKKLKRKEDGRERGGPYCDYS